MPTDEILMIACFFHGIALSEVFGLLFFAVAVLIVVVNAHTLRTTNLVLVMQSAETVEEI